MTLTLYVDYGDSIDCPPEVFATVLSQVENVFLTDKGSVDVTDAVFWEVY